MSEAPQITVLVSSYNSGRFVDKKLAEIEAQTRFAQAEFLFIETGSPDREREAFAAFCSRHENSRLIATQDRRTLYEAWNLGWEAARAPLLCYSNMDDAMHPRLLEMVVEAMQARPWDACSVLIAKQPLDDRWNDWSPDRLRRLPLSPRPGPFTAWRRDLQERIGRFDDAYVAAGDKEFWCRLQAQGCSLGLIPKVLYLYTANPASLTRQTRADQTRQRDQARLAARHPRAAWPATIRRRVRWSRMLMPLMPGRFIVPVK